jgi:hypothetical protein
MSDSNTTFSSGATVMPFPVGAACPPRERRQGWRPHFRGPLRMRRAGEKEAFLLAVICALDMYTTLYWVVMGYASEANQLLAWTFEHHPAMFVAVKGASCIPALILAPRLAQRHPRFTVWSVPPTCFSTSPMSAEPS